MYVYMYEYVYVNVDEKVCENSYVFVFENVYVCVCACCCGAHSFFVTQDASKGRRPVLPRHTRDSPVASFTKFSTVSTTGMAEPKGFPWVSNCRFDKDLRIQLRIGKGFKCLLHNKHET